MERGHRVQIVAPYDVEISASVSDGIQVERFRYTWPDKYHIMGHGRSLESDVRLKPLVYALLPLFLFFGAIKLFRATKEFDTDILHIHWVLPNGPIGAFVARLRKIPYVVSLHGSDVFIAGKEPIFSWIARNVLNRALAVTSCSEDLINQALNFGARANYQLLPWGVDPVKFHPDRKPPSPLQEDEDLEKTNTIVSLGRMVYKKGFESFVDAIPLVIQKHPKARFIIGGDGPIMSQLKRRADELRAGAHLSLPGRIPWDEVPAFLANADIFVLPSVRDDYGNQDGLPTVLLEAMSSGASIIASDIAGIGLVVNDQETGILVPPDDHMAIANAINSLLDDPARLREYQLSARGAIEANYTWDNCIVSIDEVYSQSQKV
jgi:glycosyltransferase involved in cell wall biosynthesis